jgi:hypothetical protein
VYFDEYFANARKRSIYRYEGDKEKVDGVEVEGANILTLG